MRYLLLFFISISAYGQQVLKAGVYRNLKPTAPIVLDTGSFTFTGLEFKSHIGGFRGPGFSGLNGKEVLLDASMAREITLLNCIFQGEDQKGIALQSAIEKTTVIQCRFSGLRVGILANQKQAGKGKEMVSILSVTSNTFQNLRYGVWLQAGTHTLSDFRCNQFVHTLTGVNNAGVGLYIGGNLPGQAVPALSGVIGDNGLPGNEKPNGNVWPVAPQPVSSTPWPVPPGNTLTPDQLLAGWVSPTNWTSIRNDNTNPANAVTYWSFNNEFVSNITGSNVLIRSRPGTQDKAYKVPEGSTLIAPLGIDYIPLCSNDLPMVFPLRMAVNSGENQQTEVNKLLSSDKDHVKLGNAIPNPAERTTIIPIFVPESSRNNYVLELFDLQGKQTFLRVDVKEKGLSQIRLDLGKLEAGMYAYRLLEDSRIVGTRKLVVIK